MTQIADFITAARTAPTPALTGAAWAASLAREAFLPAVVQAVTDPAVALRELRRARTAYLAAATDSQPMGALWYSSQATVALTRYQTAADEAAYLLERGIRDAVWPQLAAAHHRAALYLSAAHNILTNPLVAADGASAEQRAYAAQVTDSYARRAARHAADCYAFPLYAR